MPGSPTTIEANAPKTWETRRSDPAALEPCPTYAWRLEAICNAIKWSVVQQQITGENAAVLDIGAGSGLLGDALRHLAGQGKIPPLAYHVTEQTEGQASNLRAKGAGISAAVWSFGVQLPAPNDTLEEALLSAPDTFLRAYPVVVLSHVLEHVSDYYGLLDEVFPFVAPGGCLLVVVPKHDEHRTHFTTWDWSRLLAVLRQYAGYAYPLACWDYGPYADLVAAVWRPLPSAPQEAQPPEPAPPNGVAVVAHVDHRIQHQERMNWEETGRPAPPGAGNG